MKLLFCISFFVLLYTSCSNKNMKANVAFKCIKLSDSTLSIRIDNFSETDIFIPIQYIASYVTGYDTLYFESFLNPKYDTTWYYKYDSLFLTPVLVNRKIDFVEPDSVFNVVEAVYYNQFRVRPFMILKRDSSHIMKLDYTNTYKTQFAKFVYYENDFFKDVASKNGNYSKSDFINFEDKHSKKIVGLIYQAVTYSDAK